MITPMKQVVTIGQLNSQIKGVKNALKQPELYTDDEIRLLKRSLRELYQERTDLNRGNGFGYCRSTTLKSVILSLTKTTLTTTNTTRVTLPSSPTNT